MKLRFAIFGIALFVPLMVFASQTNGTIDSGHKFAWGEQFGWINFGVTAGNVHVTDAGLTGYAWSADFGWINLAPTQAGVKNDGNGHLSGYAWGENIGYINWSGVSINNSGLFVGSALGPNSSTITFNCSECSVVTDWRPASVRNPGGNGGNGGGNGPGGSGGGGGTGYSGSPGIPQGSTCAGISDFNCDGRVNLIDLSILLYRYGQSGAAIKTYDLNHDGIIDFPDLSILMYHWTG